MNTIVLLHYPHSWDGRVITKDPFIEAEAWCIYLDAERSSAAMERS